MGFKISKTIYLLLLIFSLQITTSCSSNKPSTLANNIKETIQNSSITYFDPISYKNLIDLKVEVLSIYDNYKEMTHKDFLSLKIKVKQALEYEAYRGTNNQISIKLVNNISKTYDDHVAMIDSKQPSSFFLKESKEAMDGLFKEAINTENNKNREPK